MPHPDPDRRKETEAELFRLLVENVADYAIFVVDEDRRVRSWNPGAERLLGYREEEILGQSSDIFFTPEDIESGVPRREMEQALGGGRGDDDRWHVRKDGSRFWSGGMMTPLRNEAGRLRGFAKIMRDRTEWKRTADESAVTRRRLQALFDNTLDAILLADDQARCVDANPAACELLGRDRDALLGRGVFDFASPPGGGWQTAWAAFLRDGRQAGEYTLRHRDGPAAVVEYRAVANVQPGLHLSVLRDVTDRRRTDQALRASERRFKTLAGSAPVGIFETDAAGNCLFVNDRWCRMAGMTPEAAMGRGWAEALHPDDRDQVLREWYAAAAAGREFAGEYRFRTSAGEVTWLSGRAVAVRDEAGVVTGYIGTVTDVTGLKLAEVALREGEERLRAIIDNSPAIIFAKDADGRYLLANRACEGYSGEPPGRMVGKTDHDFLPAAFADRFRADDLRVLRTGEVVRYEEQAPVGGEVRAFMTVKFPLRDAAGRPYAVCGIATDITDLKRADAAVRESEERLRALSDNLPHGAIYQVGGDPAGGRQFLYISAGVERLFGVTAAEATADANALYGLIHEDDRPRVAAAEETALRGWKPFDCEFRSRTRAGDVRWFHCRSAPRRLPGGEVVWEGVIIDVTEWRQAERASRASRDRLDLVVNSVDVGLWYCDLPLDRLNWNAKVKEHFGLPADAEVTIETFYERLHPADREGTRRAIGRALDNRSGYDIEYRTVGLDGRERWVRAIGRVFTDPAGRPVRFDGITLDVTERVRQEQALKEADRRKDEFLATLAHELRNPLAPIRNSLQILKMPRVDAATAERSRATMERQLQHLVRLVDDLLDVSRVMRGKIHLRRERVELAEVVARAVETAQPLVEARRHELTLDLPAGSLPLDADPVRLAQVVGNLLTNAAKYTEPGGRIRVTADRDGEELVLRVRDTGIGIARDLLPRVFDMFVQADEATTRSHGGLGLGLTLVKNLVELHGGTVEAHSPGPGRGSEFVVRLPLAAPVGEEAVRSEPHPGEPTGQPPGRRLLVVDDNADAADTLAALLRLGGHEARVAYSGQAGLEAAVSSRPDLVFLDLGMPGMDGFEVARRIRRTPGLESTMIVALTGWGQEEDRRRTADAGFDHHMVKPPDPTAVGRLLAALPRKHP